MVAMSINAIHTRAPATATRINWGPYLVGIGIGVLSWIVFVVVNDPTGITKALFQVPGGVASLVVGTDAVAANEYLAKNAFKFDYGTLFLVGTRSAASAQHSLPAIGVSRPFRRSVPSVPACSPPDAMRSRSSAVSWLRLTHISPLAAPRERHFLKCATRARRLCSGSVHRSS